MNLSNHLLALEQQLLTPQTRTNPSALNTLLTPDFREFGASGRIFTRESILTLLQSETDFTPPEIHPFPPRELTPTLALVTYQTTHPTAPTSPPSTAPLFGPSAKAAGNSSSTRAPASREPCPQGLGGPYTSAASTSRSVACRAICTQLSPRCRHTFV